MDPFNIEVRCYTSVQKAERNVCPVKLETSEITRKTIKSCCNCIRGKCPLLAPTVTGEITLFRLSRNTFRVHLSTSKETFPLYPPTPTGFHLPPPAGRELFCIFGNVLTKHCTPNRSSAEKNV